MYGIYSSHALDDATVYDDDIVVHTSNQDCFPVRACVPVLVCGVRRARHSCACRGYLALCGACIRLCCISFRARRAAPVCLY